jgi:hypothetical protein
MPGQPLRLDQWTNFYMITSAAAASLLGLMFVVISLGAERRRGEDALKIRIYLTPVIIYFSSVLVMSLLLAIPNHTRPTAVSCICLESIVGLAYAVSLAIKRGAGNAFYDARSDLFSYVICPFAAHAVMLAGGLLSWLQMPQIGLDLVAAGLIALLGIGIRNSWAIAITIASPRD